MPSNLSRLFKKRTSRKDRKAQDVTPVESLPDPGSMETITSKFSEHVPEPALGASSTRETIQRDLWNEAFEKLNDDAKQVLSAEQDKAPLAIIEDVIDLTEKRSAEYKQAGLKIARKGSKPDFNVRDGAVKLLKSVLSFKDVIGSGVGFDPTGHASSAWAVISLGLQLVQNDLNSLEAVFNSSELLADLLARYANLDKNFRDRHFDDSVKFEDTIVDVYVATLEYSTEVMRQSRRNIPKRVWQSLTALSGQPLEELLKKVGETEAQSRKWRDLIEHQYRKQESAEVNEAVAIIMKRFDDTSEALKRIEARSLTDEEHKILCWLSSIDCSESHRQAQSRREMGTGTWFLDSQHYKDWNASLHSFIWLYGPSGCGKTVLSSTIVEDLTRWCSQDSSRFLAIWYLKFYDSQTLKVENLVSSFIRQLCASASIVPAPIREMWVKHNAAGTRPGTVVLVETLDSVIMDFASVGKDIFVVVDALDEASNTKFQEPDVASAREGPRPKRKDIIELVNGLSKRHPNLHILVTSRNEIDIRGSLQNTTAVSIEDCLAGDLETYVNGAVDRMIDEDRWKQIWSEKIKARIVGQQEKRFRWANLQVQEFSNCIDDSQVEEALKTVPETLEATYERALCRIPKRNKEKARLILLLIAHSFRPLSLQEIAAAVSLPEPADVLSICTSSLVSSDWRKTNFGIWPQKKVLSEIVKLDHFSVKEYLMSSSIQEPNTSYFYKPELLAHLIVGQTLVSYILNNDEWGFPFRSFFVHRSQSFAQAMTKRPFLVYSIMQWPGHVRKATNLTVNSFGAQNIYSNRQLESYKAECEVLHTQIYRLFHNDHSESYVAWLAAFDHVGFSFDDSKPWDSVAKFPPLFCASLLGLNSYVERLIGDGVDIDARSAVETDFNGSASISALQVAACSGHPDLLFILLDKGAVITQKDLEYLAQCALDDCDKVLELLLAHRADLVVDASLVRAALSCKVFERADQVHDEVAFLLSKSSDIAINSTTIVEAVNGAMDFETIELLLNYKNVEINCSDLLSAKRHLNFKLIKILFNYPGFFGTLEERSLLYQDALPWASFHGYEDPEFLAMLPKYGGSIGDETLQRVVERQTDNVTMTKALVEFVGYHRIDEGLLRTAANNIDAINSGVMAYLLEHLENDIENYERMMEIAVAGVGPGAVTLMQWLLQHRGKDTEIKESMVIAAAKNSFKGPQLVELLLGARNPEISLSSKVIDAAFYPATLEHVLRHMRPDVPITSKLLRMVRRDKGFREALASGEGDIDEILQNCKQAEDSDTEEESDASDDSDVRANSGADEEPDASDDSDVEENSDTDEESDVEEDSGAADDSCGRRF